MANEIMLTPEELRQQADMIRKYKQAHLDVMSRLTNLVISLNTVWKGEAQDAFLNQYVGMQGTFTSFQESIEKFSELMDKTADVLEREDNAIASRIRNFD